MSNTRSKIAARLGLKPGFTEAEFNAATDKLATRLAARRTELGLHPSATVTQITAAAAARNSVAAMTAQLAAPTATAPAGKTVRVAGGPKTSRHAGTKAGGAATGPKLLSREEAQDVVAFGANTRLSLKRKDATEEHFGVSLRDALRVGLL